MQKTHSDKSIIHNITLNKPQKKFSRLAVALLMFAIVLLLGSCLSLGDLKFSTAPLMGMVYDTENLPCQGASIFLDGWQKGQTDVNGRFVIADVPMGKHTVEIKKTEFEQLTIPFNFIDRKEILYLKVISLKQILEKTEENITQKKIPEAEAMLERAKVIDPVNPVYLYLNSILLITQKKYEDAAMQLEQLITLGYKEPTIYLTMADLYEYQLQNYEKAVLALDTYVKMRPLPEAKKRLIDLTITHNLNHVLRRNEVPAQAKTDTPAPVTATNPPTDENTNLPVATPQP